MRDIFTIMKFTMKDMVKRKSFVVSTLIILLMIIVGFNIPNIIESLSGDDAGVEHMIISDRNNIYEGTLSSIKDTIDGYEITLSPDTIDELKNKIENDDKVDSAIYIDRIGNKINMVYIVENVVLESRLDDSISSLLTSTYQSLQMSKLNLTENEIASITPEYSITLEQSSTEAKGNVIVMMLASIVLFYAIYFCAYQVSSSITIEKTSKIIETLVTSTSPRYIVLGKTFGVGLVGVCQLVLFLTTAVISGNTFMDKALLDILLDTSTITPFLGFITLLYFILGYLTYALLYALTGSTVSKPEDVQSANSPVGIITIAGFYLSYFTMMNPASNLNMYASLLPISSPFCMPFRVMMELATKEEIVLSIAILIATILLIAHITIKIYSNAILNYGSKMTLKDIRLMYKQK